MYVKEMQNCVNYKSALRVEVSTWHPNTMNAVWSGCNPFVMTNILTTNCNWEGQHDKGTGERDQR